MAKNEREKPRKELTGANAGAGGSEGANSDKSKVSGSDNSEGTDAQTYILNNCRLSILQKTDGWQLYF